MVTPSAVGLPVGHIEGVSKVTGGAKYTGDIRLPGMLVGKCLRSPYPHARLVGIDTSRAKSLPGVHAVLTGADLPDRRMGRRLLDQPLLARDKVRFVGDKVAAVAAETADIAEEALLLIDVEYEELEAVFDSIAAMAPDAPRVHEDDVSYTGSALKIRPKPNVVGYTMLKVGDVEAAFARADRIFEHTFRVPAQHQGYMESHSCAVAVIADGKIDVWLTSKTPFLAREQISWATGLPEDQIRLNVVPIGGDFGGKGSTMDAPLAYHLAVASGRPVRMSMTYTEELLAANPRHDLLVHLKTGVTKDGEFLALQGKYYYNSGAYGSVKPSAVQVVGGPQHAHGCYRVPNVELENFCVYTNTVPRGHMRAPGGPQAVFASECSIDMVAHEMGIDPLELRRRNALVEGDASPNGHHYHDIILNEVIDEAEKAAGWSAPKAPNIGRGIALFDRPTGGGRSESYVTVNDDATFHVLTAVPDTGTGAHTIMQQVLAEEFRIPLSDITIELGTTDTAPFDGGAGGSKVTHSAGQSMLHASHLVKDSLIDLAGRLTERPADQLRYEDGRIVGGGVDLSLKQLMQMGAEINEPTITEHGEYEPAGPSPQSAFAAQVAEVEVDPETAQIKVRKITTVHDVGKIINPLTHQGQVDGGVMQGLGEAMIEDMQFEDGAVTNLNLGDYKLPTMPDIPELVTINIESPAGPGPYHSKGIGEHANVAIPAAIANAVFDATGIRLTELPITSEKLFAALLAKRTAS